MSMDLMLVKTVDHALRPATCADADAFTPLKIGKQYGCTLTQLRNGEFHKKVFALLQLIYETVPRKGAMYRDRFIEQSFDRFREEAVIKCGYYHVDVTGNGELRLVAHSLEYRKCSEEKIQRIYSSLINLGLKELEGYEDGEALDSVVKQILGFA